MIIKQLVSLMVGYLHFIIIIIIIIIIYLFIYLFFKKSQNNGKDNSRAHKPVY